VIVPVRVDALAAGMLAFALITVLNVAGMQNVEASATGCGAPDDSAPAAAPIAWMARRRIAGRFATRDRVGTVAAWPTAR